MNSVRVNMARLQNRMEAISAFGATAGGGVTRLALSDADRDARQQLCAWLTELGCEVKRIGIVKDSAVRHSRVVPRNWSPVCWIGGAFLLWHLADWRTLDRAQWSST